MKSALERQRQHTIPPRDRCTPQSSGHPLRVDSSPMGSLHRLARKDVAVRWEHANGGKPTMLEGSHAEVDYVERHVTRETALTSFA